MLARAMANTSELWPHATRWSRVSDGVVDWRVARHGSDDLPTLALIHGTGASLHSFGYLASELADRAHLLAFDLPGHGGSVVRRGHDMSLPAMARSVRRLLATLGVAPDYVVGHSAGMAIALQMQLCGAGAPRRIFGVNSALSPIAGSVFLAPIARLLFAAPLAANVFALQARRGGVESLLRQTGSRLSDEDVAIYQRLFADTGHIRAALGMMANWNLLPLQARMGEIGCPITLIAAADDPMVSCRVSIEAKSRLPRSDYVEFPSGGHLLHESNPRGVAEAIAAGMDRDEAR